MNASIPQLPTEFIGTTVLDTIGLIITGTDELFREKFNTTYQNFGIISSRTGAAGQICAVDEAIKNTGCEIVAIELPRDTKGWGGHGNFIIVGSNSVDDVREAVKIALELTKKNAGEVYISDAGHLEFAYSASAAGALNKAFDIPVGKAFGFMAGSPAAIGLVMADNAITMADIKVTRFMTPDSGTSHSNEVIVAFTGETEAVKSAVLAGREVGLALLRAMGSEPGGPSTPFLK